MKANEKQMRCYHRDAASSQRMVEWAGLSVMMRSWRRHRELIRALTKRELLQRYRGSMLGLCWSVMNPLVLLLIYTVVFSTIMKSQWNDTMTGFGIFAIMMYCGLIAYNFFCEMLSSSSRLILDKPNYVRKVAFPLEILPVVMIANGLIHAMIATGILLASILIVVGHIPWTAVLLPLVWAPFIVNCLAISFILSTVSTFIRDVQHVVGILLVALFFLTPVFYSSDKVPPYLRWLLFVNPVAYVTENTRKVCVYGLVPDWKSWLLFMGVSVVLLYVAACWFQVIRKRFPDVI